MGIYLFFMLGGLGAFLLLLFEQFSFSTIILSLGGAAFIAAGAAMMYCGTEPIVFDKTKSLFWKGRKARAASSAERLTDDCIRFADIHALQILSKLQTDNIGVFCELNLVLQDGRRIHILDQRKISMMREYGETLSKFLEKPLWDAA